MFSMNSGERVVKKKQGRYNNSVFIVDIEVVYGIVRYICKFCH